MSKELIVSSTILETKLAILEDKQVAEILVERAKNRGILGNIYKGKVTKVLPGMQAAFVDIGVDRHAFLYVDDVLEGFDGLVELFGEFRDEFEPLSDQSPEVPSFRFDGSFGIPPSATGVVNDLQPLILGNTLQLEVSPSPGQSVSVASGLGILPPLLELSIEIPDRKGNGSGSSAEIRPDDEKLPSRPRRGGKRGKKGSNVERPSIAGLLETGQEILVQVSKEAIGKKGARITCHVALPGRNIVFMPNVEHVGVSRKIEDSSERSRLRRLVGQLKGTRPGGFIVRTVGEGKSEAELAADMGYLTRIWDRILTKLERSPAPKLIHGEPSLVERVIRDRVNEDFKMIRVDNRDVYERIVEFVGAFNPDLVNRIRLYTRKKPIFDQFGVTPEIEKALKHRVWLKNGGHIVINQTEALVAIDVNTGRFVGSSDSLEETITKTNLDAVREVVRQIRLRDLGGIIIIDFIDMDESKNRRKVMEALQRELANDKSPSKILKFNEFGLVAITRKRSKQPLEKVFCQPCIFCSGTGITKSARTVAYSIHQELSRMAGSLGKGTTLQIRCHPEVAQVLRDGEREVVDDISEITRKKVSVKPDPLMHIEQFDLMES